MLTEFLEKRLGPVWLLWIAAFVAAKLLPLELLGLQKADLQLCQYASIAWFAILACAMMLAILAVAAVEKAFMSHDAQSTDDFLHLVGMEVISALLHVGCGFIMLSLVAGESAVQFLLGSAALVAAFFSYWFTHPSRS